MLKTIKRHVQNIVRLFDHEDALDFYLDEYWMVYESIILAMHINAKSDPEDIIENFRKYEGIVLAGIEEGKLTILRNATKQERKTSAGIFTKILQFFANRANITLDKECDSRQNLPDYQINMGFMYRCISSQEIKRFFFDEENIFFDSLSRLPEGEGAVPAVPFSKTVPAGPTERKRGQAGADASWDPRRPVLAAADDFMRATLECGCQCRHNVLATIAYECAQYEGKLVKEYEQPRWGLKKAIRENASVLVPADRVFGSTEYREASKAKKIPGCPISDHQVFTRRGR